MGNMRYMLEALRFVFLAASTFEKATQKMTIASADQEALF